MPDTKMNANDLYLFARVVQASEDMTDVFAERGEHAACQRLIEAGYITVDPAKTELHMRPTRCGEQVFMVLVDMLESLRKIDG